MAAKVSVPSGPQHDDKASVDFWTLAWPFAPFKGLEASKQTCSKDKDEEEKGGLDGG